jgi:eIF-2B alpha/beta/delta-like uncharacterized protein
LKAAQYESVDHIVEEVRAMRVRGGSAFGQAAAQAFRFVAADETIADAPGLFSELHRVADLLLAEKPTMATIHNALALIVEAPKASLATGPLATARQAVGRRADRFVAHSLSAVETLGCAGGNLVAPGQPIMMHSFSESVLAVFAAAREASKSFRVICTESRPLRESRHAASRLSAMGVDVTFVLDAAMAEAVPEADWCLVGADSLAMDGAVANKMGSNLLSIVAERAGKPFYVAAELLKLQRATGQGHPIQLEQRPPEEVIRVEEFDDARRVTVRNQFFDLTPPSRIRAIITEFGVLAPGQLASAWQAIEASVAEDA